MEKTIWGANTIDDYRNKIVGAMELEKDKEKSKSYSYDLIILNAIEDYLNDGKCFIQSINFKEKVQQDIESLTLYEDFFEEIRKFDCKRKLIPEFVVGNLDKLQISSDDVLTFIFDFYRQFDKNYTSIFDSIYHSFKDNIIFSKHRSANFGLSYNHTSFINIQKTNDIEEYISGVHEFGHSIADYIKLRYYSETNYPFIELLPVFAEINALEYLGTQMPEYKEDIITYKKSILLTLFNMAIKLIYQHDFYSKGSYNNRLLGILSIMFKNHESFRFASDTIDSSVTEKYMYLNSFLVVIELLSMNDFELAKYKLNQILKLDNIDNYLLFLYDMGINLNEHSSEYIRCIRDNKKIIKY